MSGGKDIKSVGIKAAKEAGKILLDNFGKVKNIKEKSEKNLVTEVDLLAEKRIKEILKKEFPSHGILSEETSSLKRNSFYKWIIDPLDGTHNYLKGIEIFGVSLALEYKRRIILGIIYLPLQKRLYIAEKDKGAYLNGRRIFVSRRCLRFSTVVYDSSIRLNKEPMLKTLNRLVDKVLNIRMFGSTIESLCLIAEGKIEAEIEFNDKPWDFCAGAILVEEAGGKITDLKGRPWNPYMRGYIASNSKIHKELLKVISF